MDKQSLTALLELQHAISRNPSDMDWAMHLIADRARSVANASGIAIALLKGGQLVYRAGSGCAASYVGRQLTAVLSVAAPKETRGEILRVENAQTDQRIEAAICRQLEAQSLLILPIYHEHNLMGVLKVLFSEPHAFRDRELRTYHFLTGLVEEAIFRNLGQKKPTTVPQAIEQISGHTQNLRREKSAPESGRRPWAGQILRPAATWAGPLLPVVRQPAPVATESARPATIQQGRGAFLRRLRANAGVTGVIAALVIASCWIVYHSRAPQPVSTSSQGSPLPASTAAPQQVTPLPTTSVSSTRPSRLPAVADGKTETPNSAFKRIRVGPNEVDYISEDVTIRQFTTKSAPAQTQAGYKEVQIGEDVTVRYFASKPVAPRTHSVSNAAQSVERSTAATK